MTEEEIRLKLGYDATTVATGTAAMLKIQEAAAVKYVAFWKTALAARAAAETKFTAMVIAEQKLRDDAAAASLAKAEARMLTSAVNNEAARVAIRLARAKEIEKEIEKGSGAFGSLETAAASAGGAAVGTAAASGHGGIGGIVRELGVLGREASRGSWNRAAGSLSILIQRMSSFGLVAARVGGILGAVVGAGATFVEYGRMRSAQNTESTSNRAVNSSSSANGSRLNDVIDSMSDSGAMSFAENKRVKGILGYDSIGAAVGNSGVSNAKLQAVQKYLLAMQDRFVAKQGADAAAISGSDQAFTKAQAELDEMHKKERSIEEINKAITDRKGEMASLQAHLNTLDKASVDFHQTRAELVTRQLAQEKDVTRQKELQAQIDNTATAAGKQYDTINTGRARDWMRGKINAASEEAVYPTLENLAGRGWSKAFTGQYGAGGRFDLGRGDGPRSGSARDYIRAKYQQEWDRTYGNMGDAENDRQRMVAARDDLIKQGAASPEMLLGKIEDNTSKLHDLFKAMQDNGIILKDQPGT